VRSRHLGPDREPPLGRRELLARLATVTVGLLAIPSRVTAAEPPPETTRLRVHHSQSLCLVPQYVAEDLLRGEGFTEVQYVRPRGPAGGYQALTSGEADIANDFAPVVIIRLDRGDPIVILAGGG
jgi:NitT/TauT family transport system substrate-binding protein